MLYWFTDMKYTNTDTHTDTNTDMKYTNTKIYKAKQGWDHINQNKIGNDTDET